MPDLTPLEIPLVERDGTGKLSITQEIPLDILLEIFGHLRPLDLLHLVWSTKLLRSLLMRRHAISVWQSARATVGMPGCPPDLSEPQFAFLAFVPDCHFCSNSDVTDIMWSLRVRCCDDCRKAHLVKSRALVRFLPKEATEPVLLTEASHGYINCLPYYRNDERRAQMTEWYLKSAVLDLRQQIKKLHGNEIGLRVFYDQTRSVVEATIEHAEKCVEWKSSCAWTTLLTQDQRKEFITKKLRKLGCKSELDAVRRINPSFLLRHPLVLARDVDMTEWEWADIQDEMVTSMEQVIDERLTSERAARRIQRQVILIRELSRYLSTRPRDVLISSLDISRMDVFQTILDAPVEVEVTPQDFAEPIYRLSQLSETRQRSGAQSLLAIRVPTSVTSSKDNSVVPRQELATALFYCILPGCGQLVTYHNVSSHRLGCASTFVSDWEYLEFIEDLVALFVRQCDLNPEVTTAAKMDAVDPRFVCFDCSSSEGLMVFSWRTAIAHAMQKIHLRFGRVDEDAIVKSQEVGLSLKAARKSSACDWCCTRCRERMTFRSLAWHLKIRHGIKALREVDYYRPIDASSDFIFPFVYYPDKKKSRLVSIDDV